MRGIGRLSFSVAGFLIILLACSPKDSDSIDSRIEALEDSVAALTDALGTSVDLKPEDESFSVLRMDIGSLALTLDTILPYGVGSQLMLTVANLTSAEIDGLAGTVWWGIPGADGTHEVAEQRSRPLLLSQSLPPGVWTRVTFALDSVPPDQIRFLRVAEVSATSLRLP